MFDSDRTALTTSLRAGLQAMVDGLDAAAASDDELLRHVADVEALGRLLDAARVTLAGEVAHRSRTDLGSERLTVTRGCRTPGELLERVTLVSGSTARARIRAATPLRARVALTGETLPPAFPVVAGAVASGALGVDAASAIVTALASIRERGAACEADAFAAAEQALVDAATGEGDALPAGADEVAIMANTWALFLDPDGALPDGERAMKARGLTLGRERAGVVGVQGALLPDVAAQLQRLLDAFLNPKAPGAPGPRFADEAETDESGEDVPADPRTTTQRRHDAFAGVLSVAAGMDGIPSLGGSAPTLVVTVRADQLDQASGVAFVPPTGAGDTGAVPASVARHAGCAGQIQRIVFDPAGRIVDLGTPQRLYTAHQRRAIATRDGECIIPGCHVPAAWCEVHHVQEAARGGPTHTDNGVLLCWFHHRTIETSGWEIRMVRGSPWLRGPGWLDSARRWRPATGSVHRRHDALLQAAPP
ncbi:HNH endonuclease [Microbacterium sp. dk485]|uniref:HNH endonuclease signature motif containing protein n=1 Tax=Microbacterium sp. dk485 TaxID=2560021 RepID=UPI00107412DB|nr:HNH endonuclease signature motif containing protein [Microbacterium sp. dk485]TFV85238.1 HNH endonuclease [Microbacterium sp. dk485]